MEVIEGELDENEICITHVVEPRFKLLRANLSDYKSICIGDMHTKKIICHMNTMDCDYDELLKQAQIMTESLNSL